MRSTPAEDACGDTSLPEPGPRTPPGRAVATAYDHPAPMAQHRIFTTAFSSVYPLYVQKAERKGRKKQEVDQVIRWLTGYTPQALARQTARNADFATFFAEAPALPREVEKITCVVCGVRVEEIEDPLMRKISPEAESQQPPKTTPLPDPRPPAPALEHNEPGPLAQHSASAIRPKPRPRKPRAKGAELLKRVFERLPSRATPPQQLRSAHLRRHFADPDVDHRARRRVAGVCPPLAVTAERRAGCP